jgi:hypothetical protein
VSSGASVTSLASSDDLEWLLEKVLAEAMILRPDPEDRRTVTADELAGHF